MTVEIATPTETRSAGVPHGGDVIGASMVFIMRVLLAVSALLTLFIAPGDLSGPGGPASSTLARLIFWGYLLHALTLLVATRRQRNPFWHGKAVYWIDLCWFALMVYCSGGAKSFFFPFFFFVILTSSFQWGFDEGARITLGSALALVLATWSHINVGHLLLRTTFVLALGYMIAYWGGQGLAQQRRLRLLRDVAALANPRFGVEQSIAKMLQKTRNFYHASNVVLLMREQPEQLWQLHSSGPEGGNSTLSRLPEGRPGRCWHSAPRCLCNMPRPCTRGSRTRRKRACASPAARSGRPVTAPCASSWPTCWTRPRSSARRCRCARAKGASSCCLTATATAAPMRCSCNSWRRKYFP